MHHSQPCKSPSPPRLYPATRNQSRILYYFSTILLCFLNGKSLTHPQYTIRTLAFSASIVSQSELNLYSLMFATSETTPLASALEAGGKALESLMGLALRKIKSR